MPPPPDSTVPESTAARTTAGAGPADPELAAEQEHLAESRRQLGRMRERTAAMDAAAAGDWVSREVLESTFALRMKQLADDPTVPLFFGRLDHETEVFHIGRRHVSDPSGEPMVIDWRAPVSLPFYRASRAEPHGGGPAAQVRLPARAAHRLRGRAPGRTRRTPDERQSALLEAEIERPRVGPMRDIVATIQPEQDEHRPRRRCRRSVCVQGAPGTGKTAVGLHRAAYLLYAHREQLTRHGRPGRRAEPSLPALHPRRAARARRDRGDPVHDRGAGREDAARADPRGRSAARTPPRSPCSRATPGWPRCSGGRCGRTSRAPADGAGRAARRPAVAGRGVRGRGAGRPSLRERGVRYGAARRDGAAVAGAPDPGGRWSSPATPPTTGCRTRWRAASRSGTTRGALARGRRRRAWCGGCCRTADLLAAAADGVLDDDEQALLRWARPARSPALDALVAGRRRARRRGRRPGRAHPVAGARRRSTRRRTCPR